MKIFKNKSIKTRLSMQLGLITLVFMAVVCTIMVIMFRSYAFDTSAKMARQTAVASGQRLSEYVCSTTKVMQTHASMMSEIIVSDGVVREKKREMLMNEMKHLAADASGNSVWCIFEPDVIDGMDTRFINGTGSNEAGRFCPKFISGENVVIAEGEIELLSLYRKDELGGSTTVSEPYLSAADSVMQGCISVCHPIIINGKFAGMIGTDINTAELYNFAVDTADNIAGKLISPKGIVAAHYDLEQVGRKDNSNNTAFTKMTEGKMTEGMYKSAGAETYRVSVPVWLGEHAKTKPWFYTIDIPTSEIYLRADQISKSLILYCFLGVLLITFVGWFLTRRMLDFLPSITNIIRKLSLGHINVEIGSIDKQNEIGKMKNELHQLIKGLQHISDFAHNIGKGELDAEYHALSNDDILGNSLLEMQRNLQKVEKEQATHTKAEEQRNWGSAGLAKFAEILRHDNDNMEDLAYSIVNNLVEYLDINQGSIFIINEAEDEADRVLEQKASFAFDGRKYQEQQIQPGEGLVGACYLEGKPIYMDDIPPEYITITSGLGGATPRALFICPLKINDETYGIVELASFSEIEPYQQDFVQKVSESIAATISTVRVNTRTARLLEQTRRQTSEMAHKEEMLRYNIEQMQIAQEEMRSRENEHQKTIAKMEAIQTSEKEYREKVHWLESLLNALTEIPVSVTNIDGQITFINQAALDMCGMTEESALGMKCSEYWNIENCNSEKCSLKLLRKGINKSDFKFGDRTFSTYASFLRDAHGNRIGHIEVMNDVTALDSKTKYNAVEVERLAGNLAKLAQGNTQINTLIAPSNEYTRTNYKNFAKLASSLELVRKSLDSGDAFKEKVHWFGSLLDAFTENPLSVTDINGYITFLNQAALDMLGKTREETIGEQCADVWNIANCCDSDRCGIKLLKQGISKNTFEIDDQKFSSYLSYLKDSEGNNIGHVEVITNITEETHKSLYYAREFARLMVNLRKLAQGDMFINTNITLPDTYTHEEYKHFFGVARDLELLRQSLTGEEIDDTTP